MITNFPFANISVRKRQIWKLLMICLFAISWTTASAEDENNPSQDGSQDTPTIPFSEVLKYTSPEEGTIDMGMSIMGVAYLSVYFNGELTKIDVDSKSIQLIDTDTNQTLSEVKWSSTSLTYYSFLDVSFFSVYFTNWDYSRNGNFEVVIPAGIMKTADGAIIGKGRLKYKQEGYIELPKEVPFTLSPADGSEIDPETFKGFVIEIPSNFETISPNIDLIDKGTKATITNGETTLTLSNKFNGSYLNYMLVPLGTLTPGQWTLNIPDSYYVVDFDTGSAEYHKYYLDAISATYTVKGVMSGIDSITSGIEEIEAVSPMGIRVKADSLESLPSGIWIVNGKKIVVTK